MILKLRSTICILSMLLFISAINAQTALQTASRNLEKYILGAGDPPLDIDELSTEGYAPIYPVWSEGISLDSFKCVVNPLSDNFWYWTFKLQKNSGLLTNASIDFSPLQEAGPGCTFLDVEYLPANRIALAWYDCNETPPYRELSYRDTAEYNALGLITKLDGATATYNACGNIASESNGTSAITHNWNYAPNSCKPTSDVWVYGGSITTTYSRYFIYDQNGNLSLDSITTKQSNLPDTYCNFRFQYFRNANEKVTGFNCDCTPSNTPLVQYVRDNNDKIQYIDVNSDGVVFRYILNYKNLTTAAFDPYQNAENDLRILPNPADDAIILQFTNVEAITGKIGIYNTAGSIVRTITANDSETIALNIGDLTAGLYFLKLESLQGGFYIQKFVKR